MGDPQPSACPLTPSQSEVGAECRAVASACLVLPSEPEVSGGWGRKQASFLRVGGGSQHSKKLFFSGIDYDAEDNHVQQKYENKQELTAEKVQQIAA